MATYTKKGGSGTLGFNDMMAVTHILETLLEKLRKQEMTLTEEMASALLEAGDVIAKQSALHREGGKVDADAVGAVCVKLERFLAPEEFNSNSSSMAKGVNGDANEQPNNSDYGFFGLQPEAQADTGGQKDEEDYGFFKEK